MAARPHLARVLVAALEKIYVNSALIYAAEFRSLATARAHKVLGDRLQTLGRECRSEADNHFETRRSWKQSDPTSAA